mgnify:CR=1 FL=1
MRLGQTLHRDAAAARERSAQRFAAALLGLALSLATVRALARSERRRAEAEASLRAEAGNFAQTVVDAQPTLLAYWDREPVLRFVNCAHLEWMGRARDEALGRDATSLLAPRSSNPSCRRSSAC